MSRNPYHREGKPPQLQQSVFAFVDILGYQDLTQNLAHADQQDLLVRLHKTLSSSRQWLDDGYLQKTAEPLNEKDYFSLKAFTDNIAIGWPIGGRQDGEVELGSAFSDLAAFQLTMVNEGFFVRGAISVGQVYVDEIAVFGDALLEAYEGESSLARDPRIVLTQSARRCVCVRDHLDIYTDAHGAPQNQAVIRDIDGQWFLNYLETILVLEDDVGPFFSELEKHKDSLKLKLDQFRQSPGIFAKYAWTAGYHNYFCDLHDFGDYKINIDTFAGERGFIIGDV